MLCSLNILGSLQTSIYLFVCGDLSSQTRDWTSALCSGSRRVLITGLLGKSQISIHLILSTVLWGRYCYCYVTSVVSDSVRPHRRQPTRLPRPWDSPGKNTGVGCHFLLQCMKVKSESEVTQSCLTLSDLMDCSLPGSSIHGIFQARVLQWGAIAFSAVSPE